MQENQPTENGYANNGKGQDFGPRRRFWGSRKKRVIFPDNLPLVEVAKEEMPMPPFKTPVTMLQELLSRRSTGAKYELVQIEGAIHEPTFRYRVAFNDTVASGTGRSKKEAKHAAAKKMLEKLIGNAFGEEPQLNGNADVSNQSLPSYDDNIPGNPIGTLQEMCMARRWPPPTYEMTSEEGPPHERRFTIACVLLDYREIGTGKSKKLAKRQAANKMWEKLQECPPDPSSVQYASEVGQRLGSASARYADLKTSKIHTLTTLHSHKVSEFHKNLKQSTGVKLKELQTVELRQPDLNYVNFLDEISAEQHFEVTYVDIEEKSFSGQCQCLVQLSTFPVAVCYGFGATAESAQSMAAQSALEYLRIMTRH